MRCPVCPDSELRMAERQGVEIDYCPSCRGVWLDRGELDVILERGGGRAAEAGHGHGDRHDPRTSKRGGFLSDLLGGFGGD